MASLMAVVSVPSSSSPSSSSSARAMAQPLFFNIDTVRGRRRRPAQASPPCLGLCIAPRRPLLHRLNCATGAEVSTPLKSSNRIAEMQSAEEMEKLIEESGDQMVVVDVSTRTCGPCKMIYPKLVKMSEEYPDVKFARICGDLNNSTRGLMQKWGVRAVPNFRFFRNGALIHSHTGANEDELRAYFLTHFMATLKT